MILLEDYSAFQYRTAVGEFEYAQKMRSLSCAGTVFRRVSSLAMLLMNSQVSVNKECPRGWVLSLLLSIFKKKQRDVTDFEEP